MSTVKYLISEIKQLYFNPVLNLERGYACFSFLNLIAPPKWKFYLETKR
ncbi:hypothetical protein BACI71_30041 [Bacillus mycoides]|uniref:Uncharacterized protein n=1 Tax=Bacillus mycoides TaxID=1405 RepID=A0A653WLV9_BACMY|nr:hypothetical protein BACI71_30041 [Bacillus mycoides]